MIETNIDIGNDNVSDYIEMMDKKLADIVG